MQDRSIHLCCHNNRIAPGYNCLWSHSSQAVKHSTPRTVSAGLGTSGANEMLRPPLPPHSLGSLCWRRCSPVPNMCIWGWWGQWRGHQDQLPGSFVMVLPKHSWCCYSSSNGSSRSSLASPLPSLHTPVHSPTLGTQWSPYTSDPRMHNTSSNSLYGWNQIKAMHQNEWSPKKHEGEKQNTCRGIFCIEKPPPVWPHTFPAQGKFSKNLWKRILRIKNHQSIHH